MNKNKPEIYSSSDYAGLSFKHGSFYYGYEVEVDDEWCFVAKFDGKEITIPFRKLGCSDMWDVNDCLMTGIGWILAEYELK